VVNKADLPGATATAKELRALLTLAPETAGWRPPVLSVSAKDGIGIDEVVAALDRHREWLDDSDQLDARRREFAGMEIGQQVQRILGERLAIGRRADVVNRVAERRISPRRAAEEVLETWSLDDEN
jgi:LAO/AO transport system kinase